MKKDISVYEFIKEFEEIRPNSFSREGLYALYDYMIEYEESCDTEIELDVIAICCEYTEYSDFEEIKKSYWDLEDMDDLRDNTQVIEFEGGIIIADY